MVHAVRPRIIGETDGGVHVMYVRHHRFGMESPTEETTMDDRMRFLTYRLTTAEITYHLPDYPNLLQHYIWQDLDEAPHFPVLRRFLGYWQRDLDGKLHSVKVAAQALIKPAEFRFADGLFRLQ